jgi:hypothetical protein
MAATDDGNTSPLSGQTGDTRPAAGAMNPALGRTSRDLAADQPAGFGPDPLAGADARDTFSDPDDPGRAERLGGKSRKFSPDIPPDARLGLAPTVAGDAVPDHPAVPVEEPRTRAATGFVAGLIGSAVVVTLAYLLTLAGALTSPGFVTTARAWLGQHGALDHVLGVLGGLVSGGCWGALLGLLVPRPNIGKGMLFGFLPALFAVAVVAPLAGQGFFMGGRFGAMVFPLLFHVIVWGAVAGHLCDRWLSPPSTTAV